jgi:hypothetical protein
MEYGSYKQGYVVMNQQDINKTIEPVYMRQTVCAALDMLLQRGPPASLPQDRA